MIAPMTSTWFGGHGKEFTNQNMSDNVLILLKYAHECDYASGGKYSPTKILAINISHVTNQHMSLYMSMQTNKCHLAHTHVDSWCCDTCPHSHVDHVVLVMEQHTRLCSRCHQKSPYGATLNAAAIAVSSLTPSELLI